jgi:hypothetical protein
MEIKLATLWAWVVTDGCMTLTQLQIKCYAEDMKTQIAIGGMIAGGFDSTGRYLIMVSHSGRGVFDTETWQRVARDPQSIYPEKGAIGGIGPLAGMRIPIHEINYDTATLAFTSPDGLTSVSYSEGTMTIESNENET